MSTPKSLLSYTDCLDYFDTCLRYTEGCRIPVSDIKDAFNLRMRLNNCRKLHREANAKMYPESNIMHGRSQYDAIVVRIRAIGDDDKLFVVLERVDIARRAVEGVGDYVEDEGYLPIEQVQPLQLAAPTSMEDLEVSEAEIISEIPPALTIRRRI